MIGGAVLGVHHCVSFAIAEAAFAGSLSRCENFLD